MPKLDWSAISEESYLEFASSVSSYRKGRPHWGSFLPLLGKFDKIDESEKKTSIREICVRFKLGARITIIIDDDY